MVRLSFKNGKKHGVQKIGMTMVKKNFKENMKMVSQQGHGRGGILMVLQCKREIQFRGKFEGLYFINPQVPTFTTP